MPTITVPSTCEFSNGNCAQLHFAEDIDRLSETVAKLEIARPRPTLVVVGGAGKMSSEVYERLSTIFNETIAPLVERLGAVVVDGGTDSGVMKLIGNARAASGSTFPLIGVAAIGTIEGSGIERVSSNAYPSPLQADHTHFVLVPGDSWGDEGPWIASTATLISGSAPSCTIVFNGGNITWKDVDHSVGAGRPTLVFDGSGRAADELAAELRGEPADDRAAPLVASSLVQSVDLASDAQELSVCLATLLMHQREDR